MTPDASVRSLNSAKVEGDSDEDHPAREEREDAASHGNSPEKVGATQLTICERSPSSPSEDRTNGQQSYA